MGGAGKTAIADRFLNELPVGRVSTTTSLPSPGGIFVYSFYDDDKPENFFRHLQMWIERDSSPDKQKSPTQLMFDIQQHEGLIILDGLEKVQESGARGGFGRLTSPSLRDLLNHIACGAASELGVLVTSRFPLTDLRDSQSRFFHTIPVDQIDVSAGVALLRDRGVRGTDAQLAPIVEHCGRHALTIDLAGGYIKEYGHGNPSTPLDLGTAEELQAEAEQEPDDDKRAVLEQGIRFARIAQRYREAMQSSDEAALALLERICLFRLGVDCETLAAIFTGPAAEKVSGKALAGLDAHRLQKKLDWLVKMRIVERLESLSTYTETRRTKPLYNIHPAVRDGFLRWIGREAAAIHEAICQGVEKTLEERRPGYLLLEDGRRLLTDDGNRVRLEGHPGEQHPSHPATLDLLEEIVHHTLESGFVEEAWQVYENRLGGSDNLGWRLGAFARGQRICQQFTQGTFRESLTYCDEAQLWNDQAFYLKELGDLPRASLSLARSTKLARASGDVHAETFGYLERAETFWLKGRLQDAREAMDPAFGLPCEDGEKVWSQSSCYAARGYLQFVRGLVGDACKDFRESLGLQQDLDHTDKKEFAYGEEGLWGSLLHLRLGRSQEVNEGCESNLLVKRAHCGTDTSLFAPLCQLVLASLATFEGNLRHAAETLTVAHEWALQRADKELLCWSALVKSRIELLSIRNKQSVEEYKGGDQLTAAEAAIDQGLKIARDCGYGLYHIDLLLERARLHLLRGDAGAALDDIEVALDTGIPANEETGQVELLAANHEQCGYAWAIPAGLGLRAEALLLQAAQQLGRATLTSEPTALAAGAVPDIATTQEPDASAFGSHDVPAAFIEQAKQLLHEALDCWHDLRDPEPTEDNNFVHPKTGKEYNYKAEETHQVLVDLEGGMLTRYPLSPIPHVGQAVPDENEVTNPSTRSTFATAGPTDADNNEDGRMKDFFISYNGNDKQWAEWIAFKLEAEGYETVIQAWDFRAGGDFVMEMQKAAIGTKRTIAVLSDNYLNAEFTQPEWTNAFARDPRGNDRTLVPVRIAKCKPQGLLATRIYIDLVGLSEDEARKQLIESLQPRGKPDTSPAFPGSKAGEPETPPATTTRRAFPGQASTAVEVWREKLEFLQAQEPLLTAADQKFALKKQIEEAEQKIRELGD
jgi:hypothetical protein